MRSGTHALLRSPLALTGALALALPAIAAGRQDDAVQGHASAAPGADLFAQRCAACHGADLHHGEGAPELIGPAFLQRWGRLTPTQQIDRLRATMPQDDPGTLTVPQATALRDYIAARNCPALPSKPLSCPAD